MGWYSKHIMGGDPPEDAMAHVLHAAKIKRKLDDAGFKRAAQSLTEIQDDLIKWAASYHEAERNIAFQVIGVAMMKYGAAMSDTTRAEIIRACDTDDWAQHELERRIYIQDFKSIVMSYDNQTPTEESINHEERFGVTDEDWMKGKFSSNMAKMALHYIHQAYKDEDWYKDTTLCLNSGGYAILMGIIDDKDSTNFPYVINNVFGLFEVPVMFVDAKEMQYVPDENVDKIKYHGNINYKA